LYRKKEKFYLKVFWEDIKFSKEIYPQEVALTIQKADDFLNKNFCLGKIETWKKPIFPFNLTRILIRNPFRMDIKNSVLC
jgi:hypothetical protein